MNRAIAINRDELGPVAQAVRIGFWTLRLALLFLGAAWATGNIRQVPADRRVVVMRFGHVAREQSAGLVLALPQPFESIVLLPSADTQIPLSVNIPTDGSASVETDFQIHQQDDAVSYRPQKDAMNAAYLLTGDGAVIRFDTKIYYTITAPRDYVLAQSHVEPALKRLYHASAVALSGTRELDDFLVARPERPVAEQADHALQREKLPGDVMTQINRRLDDLARQGSELGVRVRRVDIVALLPPLAKYAFDSVLTVSQNAEQNAAAARTDAITTRQQAERAADQTLATAQAQAAERVQQARASTAAVAALARGDSTQRPRVLDSLYRERIGDILGRAEKVTGVDAAAGQNLMLLGGQSVPAANAGTSP